MTNWPSWLTWKHKWVEHGTNETLKLFLRVFLLLGTMHLDLISKKILSGFVWYQIQDCEWSRTKVTHIWIWKIGYKLKLCSVGNELPLLYTVKYYGNLHKVLKTNHSWNSLSIISLCLYKTNEISKKRSMISALYQ